MKSIHNKLEKKKSFQTNWNRKIRNKIKGEIQ